MISTQSIILSGIEKKYLDRSEASLRSAHAHGDTPKFNELLTQQYGLIVKMCLAQIAHNKTNTQTIEEVTQTVIDAVIRDIHININLNRSPPK